ncbi:type II secretion system F family protein [Aestuariivirga litoralis]|uniref:Type II secretion system F family protein n=1 Tax=Aestuariivirga litoralis TaxID=2650924 RepID=A0A2W2BGZ0_9HYPH|nr:type II secretion system F family protein [Aestuariivirga litoralis]PZF75177.1 type II secretion system F family protein [Aestuariivirga litoralis]
MEQITAFFAARGDLLLLAAVFLAVASLTFAFGTITASWSGVRRRVNAGTASTGAAAVTAPAASVQRSSGPDYLKGLMPTDETKKSELVKFLNSAGYYGDRALVLFQASRIGVALLCGMATAALFGRLYPGKPLIFTIAAAVVLTAIGYMLPRAVVSVRRDKLFEEHRQGFPDFLDLLVICVEAGIGVDSAMERISRDLARDYPSLARNLGFMSLEMRAGKSTREALDNLGVRLGIPEAKSFSTLIRQSEELGTSLVQSLRVYSEEMRQKRLARAEEKAFALPVKLVLPLGFFIFPVVLGVTLVPVVIKLFTALGISKGQ